jgi:hypothetical protein
VNRQLVSSSNIISIGYDEPTQTLEVEFINGTIYQYYNLGAPVYEEVLCAPSKGQFLNTYIKTAYPYSRVG